jgi:hypothetical protein
MTEPSINACALIGNTLAIETLGLLTRKGILTSEEAAEAIDRCLLNFETQTAKASGEFLAAIQIARQLCETSLAQLRGQR